MKRQKGLITLIVVVAVVALLSVSVSAAVNPAYAIKICDSTSPLISDTSPMFVNTNGFLSCLFTLDPDVPLVMCNWNQRSPTNNVGTAHCIVMSTEPDAIFYYIRYRTDGTIYSPAVSRTTSLSYSSGGVTYYYASLDGNNYECCYPVDGMPGSSSDAFAACVAALNYSPTPRPVGQFSIVLYPGYALEIITESGFDGTIEALQPVKNVLPVFYSEFGGYWWPGCPSGYDLSSSSFDLSVGSVLSSSSFSRIPWLRVDTDFLGQTKQSKWTSLFASSHVLFYNPYLYIDSSPLRGNYDSFNNTPITINIISTSSYFDYKLYKLSDNVVTGLTSATIDSTVVEVYDKNPDLMGGFINSDGSPVVQKIGGALASDNDQQLTLDSLVADLDNFFRGSWEHIRFLINSLSDFPAFVVSLYSWLPVEFRSVLFSAFSIAMVVGVLKVLL